MVSLFETFLYKHSVSKRATRLGSANVIGQPHHRSDLEQVKISKMISILNNLSLNLVMLMMLKPIMIEAMRANPIFCIHKMRIKL